LLRVVVWDQKHLGAILRQSPRYIRIIHIEANGDAQPAKFAGKSSAFRSSNAISDEVDCVVFDVLSDQRAGLVHDEGGISESGFVFRIELVLAAEDEDAVIISGD